MALAKCDKMRSAVVAKYKHCVKDIFRKIVLCKGCKGILCGQISTLDNKFAANVDKTHCQIWPFNITLSHIIFALMVPARSKGFSRCGRT